MEQEKKTIKVALRENKTATADKAPYLMTVILLSYFLNFPSLHERYYIVGPVAPEVVDGCAKACSH